jgi:oligosaccharide repeat unit polymerase
MLDYVYFIIGLIFLCIFCNIIICYLRGGLRSHFLNYFILTTFFVYLIMTPVFYFSQNFYFAFEMDVKDYFGIGFLQIFLHLIFYSLGYFIFVKKPKRSFDFTSPENRIVFGKGVQKKLLFLFLLCYLILFLNTFSAGINLIDIFIGKYGEPTMGLKGGSYYLQNLADSLIGFLLIGYFFKIDRKLFVFMLVLSIPLFLVLGFRYRLILSFFGIFIIYIYDNKITLLAFFKYLFIVFVAFYILIILTLNRFAIYMQKFDEITFDIAQFDYDNIFSQSRGSMIDFAVYKYIDNEKGVIDFGETMFAYTFIKMTPSSFFNNGIKPYPPPQLLIIDEAINGTRDNGEAVTSLGGSFIAFYYPGIYVLAFLLGFTVAFLQNRVGKSELTMISSIIISLALFQWISRGYLPGFIDHLVYMIFPVLLIKIFHRKVVVKNINLIT